MNLEEIEKISKEVNRQIQSMMTVERRELPLNSKVGYISLFADGIGLIEGLTIAKVGQKVRLPESTRRAQEDSPDNEEIFGQVMDIDEISVKCIIFGEERFVKQGDSVVVFDENETVSVFATTKMLGNVVDPFGRQINDDDLPSVPEDIPPEEYIKVPLEAEAISIAYRAPVNKSLLTGIKSIDTCLPIGKGQRMLLIGDRGTGKTSVALTLLLSQGALNNTLPHNKRKVLIYVAIGKKISEIVSVYKILTKNNVMDNAIIVASKANDPASLVYISPFAATSIAEFFRSQGKESVIIYDDLTTHAHAYRHISLLLGRPPGREAYPGDIFYIHAKLLERTANVYMKREGDTYFPAAPGTPEVLPLSITSFPIVQTKDSDFSAYIPTNIISITDGQIYLDTELANKKVLPAVNIGLSVSRIGSAAQSPLVKSVSKNIKYDLIKYYEKSKYASFGFDMEREDEIIIRHGERLLSFLKQKEFDVCDEKTLVVNIVALYLVYEYENVAYFASLSETGTPAALLSSEEALDSLLDKWKVSKLTDIQINESGFRNIEDLKRQVLSLKYLSDHIQKIDTA